MKKIIIFSFFVLLIGGCGRSYFEPNPNNLTKKIYVSDRLKTPISSFTRTVVTFDKNGFVGIDENISKKGTILKVGEKEIKFNSLIATASQRGNLIAIIFADNHFELYDLSKNKSVASEDFGTFLALRKFIAQPYFYKDLLLLPTLNGKLVIFDLKTNKIVRSIVVSQTDYFNNIIYLKVVNDNLIVASRDKILVITTGMVYEKNYNIKHILTDNNGIYIFTIEGRVIKLNFALKEIKEKEFKYANIIFPMFYKNDIYFLSRGAKSFLVKLDKSLNKSEITPLMVRTKDNCDDPYLWLKTDVFGKNGTYYIGDYILKLK